ncbi:protein DESIGUAL 2-like [Henckelia pumila]|uniref:protein DESIGUAL 2-like n=1 Tax=Henckelia pumila TaxID=405737 RepID=UPI003C6DF284
MAKNMGFLVCLLIMALDIAAGILGIQAEIAQNKAKNLRVWIVECRDPSNLAFNLGLAAVALLFFAHVIANFLAGCVLIMCKEELDRASPNKRLAFASHILSWITMGIAFMLLISGTLANSKSRKDCGIEQHRLLSIGGVVCFIHALSAVSYYLYARAAVHEERKLHQPAAAA